VKWFNIGEHYRYERPQKGRLRAFYQLNVDILGEQGPAADAELITLLCQSLQSFGLDNSDFKIRLSDRDLWLLMLAAEGLDEEGSACVLGIIDKLERTDRTKTIERLSPILGDEAEDFLGRIEEVIAIHDFDTLRSYIESLPLEGDLAAEAKARIEEWSQLLRSLKASGVGDFIKIDLGIVRGLAYYTGFVFEAFEASGEGRALAGGGRYDSLVKKLGGPDMPAVGFAMGDVTLVDLLESKSLMPKYIQRPEFIAIIGGEDERDVALADAAQLRAVGYQIEYPFKNQGFAKQFKSANQSGARFALIYGSEELERGVVKVRDLSKGSEVEIPRDQLLLQVPALLERGIE
jgi:histidyl-tRNA synthetase